MTAHSVDRMIFVEDRLQALWVGENIVVNQRANLIALTAEALQALEEMGIACTPISQVADTRLLASAERQYSFDCLYLLRDIEAWILEKYPPAGQVGRGFLTGQAYYVQMSVGSIATRAFLMREAVRAFSPAVVTIFHDGIDEWFGGDGYERNPWIETFLSMSADYDFQVEIVRLQKTKRKRDISRITGVYLSLRSRAIEWTKYVLALWRRMQLKTKKNANAFRLLFADAQFYDWAPVLKALRNDQRFSLSFLKSASLEDRGWWAYYYRDVIYDEFFLRGLSLKCAPIRFDKTEQDILSALLDDWISAHPEQATMNVLGMELLPALLRHLRSMLLLSVPLMRYTNEMAIRVLDINRPDAVCFNSMTWLSPMSLALRAQQRGIPVISYQHGGSYGVQVVPTHDFAEFAYSDYFLNYGKGVQPPENPITPTRARFIPVGSALNESIVRNNLVDQNIRKSITVLWIGEVSLKNTVCGAWLVEDTLRFQLEKKSLEILGTEKMNVVYRPFPYNRDALGVPEWLQQAGLPMIQVDKQQPLKKSIQESDVIICDSSSSTTWNEVLALGKPLIVYCDPQQTILTPHFATDLEEACYWCKSVPELLEAMNRLAKDTKGFLEELRQRPTNDYLRKYVLHERDSVEHVVSFLSAICAEKPPLQSVFDPNTNEPKLAGIY